MENHSVICLATSCSQAENIVEDLRLSLFADENISVLIAHEETETNEERAMTSGRSLSRTLADLPEVETIHLPDYGPFIAAGPLVDAIVQENPDCGIAEGLIRLGIPEEDARHYESRLHDGQILIAVHSEDSDEVAFAKKIFKAGLVKDICISSAWSLPCI